MGGIDLVLGYTLSNKRQPCLDGVDFTQEGNIRSLMMEAMRYHPPVTVLPTWVKDESNTWQHELICLDRALADPAVFPEPDTFMLNRPEEKISMSWAGCALVDGDKAHPNSRACPAQELGINMVVAFVKEYQAAGPWIVENDNFKISYYGTGGFKVTKTQAASK